MASLGCWMISHGLAHFCLDSQRKENETEMKMCKTFLHQQKLIELLLSDSLKEPLQGGRLVGSFPHGSATPPAGVPTEV